MKVLMDELTIKRSIARISYEIIERHKTLDDLVLIGIKTRGVVIAKRIKEKIFELEKVDIPLEILDISSYRDDITDTNIRKDKKTQFKNDLMHKKIVIVDDVLYTGRTIRAALDAILNSTRPSNIQLACLVDRGHRELPIRADFIGKNIPTSRDETVKVYLMEQDNLEYVSIF